MTDRMRWFNQSIRMYTAEGTPLILLRVTSTSRTALRAFVRILLRPSPGFSRDEALNGRS